MKRLAILAITTLVAAALTACGDKPEKKIETQAQTQMEQDNKLNESAKSVDDQLSNPSTTDTATPAPESTTTPAEPQAAPTTPSEPEAPVEPAAPAGTDSAPTTPTETSPTPDTHTPDNPLPENGNAAPAQGTESTQ